MEHTVYLSLGSNLGDRAANLRQAVALLPPQMTVRAKSNIYETPPWGYTEQEAFLNQAVRAETYLEPEPLLKHIKRLEAALGRTETFRYGPRLIDIDILFYDNLILNTPLLTIPHPHLHERGFVLVPLMDIAPDHVHPLSGKSVREMLAACDATGIRLYAKPPREQRV
ncbi:MAG: 2-amino-4-hydroxy-6-hydroxymethyldihydropteridine diphosphokinase [Chloroflexota bacterium]|nr:2-amino-4-hydroxy-6-hydroxymethyldihydropteridine diphosphokinase [Chloroflexota bacterium]MBI5704683.1 2-amino-4-hydroxy-6-hydroxymethyldihydropteridine diphosphokinase [Chloroflexota bacterium]